MFHEYLNKAEETEAVVDEVGWYCTNDMAFCEFCVNPLVKSSIIS